MMQRVTVWENPDAPRLHADLEVPDGRARVLLRLSAPELALTPRAARALAANLVKQAILAEANGALLRWCPSCGKAKITDAELVCAGCDDEDRGMVRRG